MNKKITISIIILAITVITGGFWYTKNQKDTIKPVDVIKDAQKEAMTDVIPTKVGAQEGQDNENAEESKIENIDTSNWKTYWNEDLGLEVKYPEDWFCMVTMLNTNQIFCSNRQAEDSYLKGEFNMQDAYIEIDTDIINDKHGSVSDTAASNLNIESIKKRFNGPKNSDVIITINSAFNEDISKDTLDIYETLSRSFKFIN